MALSVWNRKCLKTGPCSARAGCAIPTRIHSPAPTRYSAMTQPRYRGAILQTGRRSPRHAAIHQPANRQIHVHISQHPKGDKEVYLIHTNACTYIYGSAAHAALSFAKWHCRRLARLHTENLRTEHIYYHCAKSSRDLSIQID